MEFLQTIMAVRYKVLLMLCIKCNMDLWTWWNVFYNDFVEFTAMVSLIMPNAAMIGDDFTMMDLINLTARIERRLDSKRFAGPSIQVMTRLTR